MSRALVVLALLFTACGDKDADDSTPTDDSATDDSEPLPVSVSGAWVDQSTYTLTIVNGVGSYELGFAQTGAAPNWYGEDCITAESICHPTSATGLTLTSVHPVVGGGGIPEVAAGSTTLLYADLDAGLTYLVRDTASTACWVWGQDTSYYDSLGCTVQ